MKKTLKTVISIMLTLIMLLTALPVFAAENNIVASGECGDNLTWSLDNTGTLTISGEGKMDDYEWAGETPWYEHQSKIKKVVIKGGVLSVGKYSFDDYTNLTKVVINDGVLSIGEYSFYDCTNLTEVDFGNTIESIGRYAFRICSSLSNIELPDSLKYIGFSAFESCDSLTNVEIPDSVTEIDSSAFAFCDNLTTIKLSDNITEISDQLFFYCTGLTDVVIPEKVTKIGGSAFDHCENLVTIKVPANVEIIGDPDIGDPAFSYCTKLSYIEVDTDNQNFSNDNNGVLFDKNKETLIQYPIGNNSDEYIVPESVSVIDNYAFTDSVLTKITLPENQTAIGGYAFSNCTNLENINLPNKITDIDTCAFYNCINLKQISIPPEIEEIWFGTFSGCKNLTDIIIPDNVRTIDNCAFEYCEKLTNVTMSNNIISIGNWAFRECVNLTSINLPESLLLIHDFAFSGCENLEKVEFANPYTKMSPGGMYDGTGERIFPETTEIYGYKNSSAEEYAQEFNREFVSLGTYNKPLIAVMSGTCGENATWNINNAHTLTISGTGKIKAPYNSNGFNVWEYDHFIDRIIINEGITEFHYEFSFVFFDEIIIPSSVSCIDENVFAGRSGIKKITFLNPDIEIKIDENTSMNAIHPDTTIYGYDNSTAHKYAEQYGNEFVSLGEYKPHEHSYTSSETKPATCKESGVRTFTCECGDSYTEAIPVLTTHTFGNWAVVKPATYEEEGTEERICSICGKKESKTIAKSEYTDIAVTENESIKLFGAENVVSLPETTVGALLDSTKGNITVTDKDGKEVSKETPLASGMTVTLKDSQGKVTDTKTVIIPGDNDGDGAVSSADARTALRAAVGLDSLNSWQFAASDVEEIEKKEISSADARYILRAAVGLETVKDWMKNI